MKLERRQKYVILRRSDFILKAMAFFGKFKLEDGSIRYAMQNLILNALWKLLKMGKTGVQETIHGTTKVKKMTAMMMERKGGFTGY